MRLQNWPTGRWCKESESGISWLDSESDRHVCSSLLHQSGNDGSISDRHRGPWRDPPIPYSSRDDREGRKSRAQKEGRKKMKKKKKLPRGSSASCVKSELLPKEIRHPIVTAESSVVTATSRKLQRRRRKKDSPTTLNNIIKMHKRNILSILVSSSATTKRNNH